MIHTGMLIRICILHVGLVESGYVLSSLQGFGRKKEYAAIAALFDSVQITVPEYQIFSTPKHLIL